MVRDPYNSVIQFMETQTEPLSFAEVYNKMLSKGLKITDRMTKPHDAAHVFLSKGVKEGLIKRVCNPKNNRVKFIHKNHYDKFAAFDEMDFGTSNEDYPNVVQDTSSDETNVVGESIRFKERDLHQLLANYLWSKGEYPKTVYHEQSNRSDTAQKWVHPDMISASFVKMNNTTVSNLLRATEADDAMKFCSYELKIKITTDYELKQAFFQALSNSNWANYGYLVAFEITDNVDVLDEMERLSQSFGIGIIKLDYDPLETKVLFPARKKDLEFKTIDKICSINPDFKQFVDKVTTILTAEEKVLDDLMDGLKRICDARLEGDKLKEYCNKKYIPQRVEVINMTINEYNNLYH